ncbi:hypothetical protein HDU93_009323 [Gonapodya sp. JEL0774]|nr:hypothetical protein HDU93_009323 [Gonapodya sp. JEL0774]
MELGLKGAKALITGGSKGIGRSTALLLAKEGVDVAICARNQAEIDSTVKEIQAFGGEYHERTGKSIQICQLGRDTGWDGFRHKLERDEGRELQRDLKGAYHKSVCLSKIDREQHGELKGSGRAVDVRNGDEIKAWVADVTKEFGGLDLIVCNVSAFGNGTSEADWTAMFEVDLLHTVRVVEAALPALRESVARRGDAAVVNITSVSARQVSDLRPYGPIKAALTHQTQQWANTYAKEKIRFNTVAPGPVYFEGGVWGKAKISNPERYNRILSLNPMGRMGTPEEIANSVVFLLSTAATYITGANLVVDGGQGRGLNI